MRLRILPKTFKAVVQLIKKIYITIIAKKKLIKLMNFILKENKKKLRQFYIKKKKINR